MDPDDAATWRRLLAGTVEAVGDAVHARWICESAAGATPDELRTMLDDVATQRMVVQLDEMVARARTGEPIQYVLGSWGFRRLDLAVDDRVLIPRPETELVAEIAIDRAASFGPIRTVADLGTGSGAIGLALADELPVAGTTVWMTDVAPPALEVARANVAGIGRSGANVRISEGSWTDALPTWPAFDVIVTNPPYVADASDEIETIVSEWEPVQALFAGPDGLDDIRVIVPSANERLRPGGWLVLEHGHDQGAAVRSLMTSAGFVDVETTSDLAGHPRATSGRRSADLFAASDDGSLVVRHLLNRIDDYGRLVAWLTTAEVLEWYEGRDQVVDLSRVLAEYGPGGECEGDGTIPAIIELDDKPIGYVQLYELDDPEDAAGFDLDSATTGDPAGGEGIWSLDLFIGEPDLFGRGVGRAVCRSAAEFVLHAYGARDVVILPYVENARAIASYRAAGFEGDHVVRDHDMHEGRLHDALRLHYR